MVGMDVDIYETWQDSVTRLRECWSVELNLGGGHLRDFAFLDENGTILNGVLAVEYADVFEQE